MRVMLITPLYPPLRGGAATYSSMIADYVQEHVGLEHLFVLTERASDAAVIERKGSVTVMRYLAPRLSRPILNPALRWLTGLAGLVQVVFLVRQLRIDVVHWHNSAIIRAREIFSQRLRLCPVLLDIRDSSSPTARLAGCDHYIASSRNIQEYVLQAGISSDMVTYIPVPFTIPKPLEDTEVQAVQRRHNLQNDNGYLLFVGDLSEQKGVVELLEGFKLFASRGKELSLVFVGSDRSGGRLASLIGKSGCATYLGALSTDNVMALIRGAACVVLPAKGEALSRVILEAIALGRPVVCPPGVPEFVDNCPDFVLDEVSPQAIAAKLAEILDSGKIASYPFELHAPQKSMKQLVEVYCNIKTSTINEHGVNNV